jgi:hypothetical protein
MPDTQPAEEGLPSQHEVFAHWVLPQVAHERGPWLLSVLAGQDGGRLLGDLWNRAGAEVLPNQLRSSNGLGHAMSSLTDGRVVAVIGLPPPELNEAYMVAVFARLNSKTDPSFTNLSQFRVFSLDRGDEGGEAVTHLGEWTSDRQRVDLGTGPAAEKDAFVQACLRIVGDPPQVSA